jgi:RNA polymerase sigma factor (sigma-70 family)
MARQARQDVAELLTELLAYPETREDEPLVNSWAAFYGLLSSRLARIGIKVGLRPSWIEDKIQDVFLALLARWQDYRPSRAKEMLALSKKMMHDLAVDEIRRHDRRHVESLDALAVEPTDRGVNERERQTEAEKWNKWVEEKLKELNEENEENCKLFRAHYFDGRSCKDLAAETGFSIRAIEGRLSRMLQKLRHLAKEQSIDIGSTN